MSKLRRTDQSLTNARARFGEKLRSARQRVGLSQEALGALAGIHRTYIGAVERGERNPSLDNIYRLARTLGVEPAELMPELESTS